MGLWKIWLAGLAITIITSILIHKKTKIHRILVDILVVVSIALVGGIAEGWAISLFWAIETSYEVIKIVFVTMVAISVSAMIWCVGSPVLGIFKKNRFRTFEIGIFILAFIIASVCWAQLFVNYNNNIEDIDETIVVGEQKNQLLYFCNIPVQQVSGSISGEVSGFGLWVDGEISGSISTLEELPYWYLNGNDEGKYNSAPTNSSTIRFIEENEETYVEVITYRKQTRIVNHNNGEENTVTEGEWKEYIFYLPQTIMNYNLN